MKLTSLILLMLSSSAVMAGGVSIGDFTFDAVDIQSETNLNLPMNTSDSNKPSDEFLKGLKAGIEKGRAQGISECAGFRG